MFTSRAEFRLSLRVDNADQRLTQRGYDLGCVSDERLVAYGKKMDLLESGREILEETTFTPRVLADRGVKIQRDGPRRSALELLSFPDIEFHDLVAFDENLGQIQPEITSQLKKDATYANYISRQKKDVDALKRDEGHQIPDDFDYCNLPGLSNELTSKLSVVRPRSLAQASRIEGVTPAALTLILAHLRQRTSKRA